MKQLSSKIVKRRGFMLGAATAGVALGSGALATAAVAEVKSDEPSPPSLGYRETEHIRAYYRLARF